MLKKHILDKALAQVMVLVVASGLSSCLGSDDDEIVTYDDTAVTGFMLTSAKRVLHTTAHDGVTDSAYTVSLVASNYRFYIDQLSHEIYNADSLPLGTDLRRTLCSISTKNSGTAYFCFTGQAGQDSLVYYTSSDSVDFRSPVRLRVYNMSGTAYRQYTIRVNVHQQDSLDFRWTGDTIDVFSRIGGRKMLEKDGQAYLFGDEGGQTAGFVRTTAGWQRLGPASLPVGAYRNMVVKDGRFYTLAAGDLYASADGQAWERKATPNDLGGILGATPYNIYGVAVSDGHILRSPDNGATWLRDSLDDSVGNLPNTDLCFTCKPSATNDSTFSLVIVGTRGGETRVWGKVEEAAAGSESQPWAFYLADSYNAHRLPPLANLQVINYADGLLALGGDFSTFYLSQDGGLTWFAAALYALPEGFAREAAPFALFADSSRHLYVSRGATMLSARPAYLGWATRKLQITE